MNSKIIPVNDDASDIMKITPLGAGQEVGRSCILVEYKNKTILLDCGLHPAYTGIAALPFFDEIDPSTIDLLLITQYAQQYSYKKFPCRPCCRTPVLYGKDEFQRQSLYDTSY